jgi:predicted GIY-YIG superfamily endonuclease
MVSLYVYILRCSDNSFYIGSSEDVIERISAHNKGTAASYTRNRRPVTLVYSEECESKTAAVRRERQIKRWSRDKKKALIAGNLKKLKRLSKTRK